MISKDDKEINISFIDTIKLDASHTLSHYFTFRKGMQPYEKGKGNPKQTSEMIKQRIYTSTKKVTPNHRKLLKARDVIRYSYVWNESWVLYGKNLAAPRKPEIFQGPRIILRRIISGNTLLGSFCEEDIICNTDVICILPKKDISSFEIKFFLGIINSAVCLLYLKGENINLDRKVYPKLNINSLENFPVPDFGFLSSKKYFRQKVLAKLVAYVDTMLELNKKLPKVNMEHEKTVIQRQINATDRKIDQLVYKLYDLTEEEVKIVEGSVE